MRLLGSLAAALCMLAAGAADAQAPTAQYSPDDFVKAILKGPQPCPKGRSLDACEANPKTRRFSLATPADTPRRGGPGPVASPTSRPARPPRAMALVAKPAKLASSDVLVTFAVGSAQITPQGEANLRSIAAGLNKPALAELAFEVAGFTDVTGPAAFNRALSQQRAEAVKAFLATLDVKPERLTAVGYGAEHLADPDDPASEANRRVELHRLN